MRRSLFVVTLVALLGLATSVFAATSWQNYKDKFDNASYSGSNGSIHWDPDWIEFGENNGPGAGKVRVTGSGCSGQCLSIGAGLLGLAGGGAYRLADTEEFANANLSYAAAFDGGGLLGLLNATLYVEVTSNDGSSWSTVDTVTLGIGDEDFESRSVSVDGFLGDEFGIRFRVAGTLGATVLVDNVEIGGELLPPPTTTSTTTTTISPTSTTTTTLPKLTTTTLPKVTTTTITLPPTTIPKVTTSTTSTTTTTIRDTTTTSSPSTTTTRPDDEDGTSTSTTSTTLDGATGAGGGPDDPGGGGNDGGIEDGSDGASGEGETGDQEGLRETPVGLGGNFEPGIFGDTAPEVLGFEIAAGFSDAVELVEASWIWALALALLIAGALVKGIDRRVVAAPSSPASDS